MFAGAGKAHLDGFPSFGGVRVHLAVVAPINVVVVVCRVPWAVRQVPHFWRLVSVRRRHLLVRVPVNTAAVVLSLAWMADGLCLVAVRWVTELVNDIFLCRVATRVWGQELGSGPLLVSWLVVLLLRLAGSWALVDVAGVHRHLASCLMGEASMTIDCEGWVVRERVVALLLNASVIVLGVAVAAWVLALPFDQVILINVVGRLFARRLWAATSVALAHHLGAVRALRVFSPRDIAAGATNRGTDGWWLTRYFFDRGIQISTSLKVLLRQHWLSKMHKFEYKKEQKRPLTYMLLGGVTGSLIS